MIERGQAKTTRCRLGREEDVPRGENDALLARFVAAGLGVLEALRRRRDGLDEGPRLYRDVAESKIGRSVFHGAWFDEAGLKPGTNPAPGHTEDADELRQRVPPPRRT
jgi:hypothetical protein